MSTKTILLISADLLIFMIVTKIVFGNFKEFKRGLFYLFKPDIVSIIDKTWDKDFNYTHKFLFVVIVMVIIGLIEFYVFY